MSARSPLRRGFTLLEVMTAVAIVIILASLAVSYMMYGMGKARMNNAVFDTTAMVSAAQMSAVSRGTPHYLIVFQTPDNRVHVQLLERPVDDPPIPGPTIPTWDDLDLTNGPDVALTFTRTLPSGTVETRPAITRDQLTLGTSTGSDAGGVAFLDLDSTRITKPLPPPFSAIAMTTPMFNPPVLNQPTQNIMAGCNFCVDKNGHPYGVLRFNPDGTMEVLTGNASSGAVIAFAPNTSDEKGFTPKLLTVSAPAGAAVVF